MCRHRSWNDAASSARNPADRAHCHHSSITRRGWLAAKKFNDIRRGATAYTNVLNVFAHSCAVDSILLTACLDRILAQVEVAFSNSLIEAYWRSLKHQWLFLNTLDSVARVRAMVEFYVNEHNKKMPHPAFSGQTPDEMFFGIGAKVPEELALAKGNAWATRIAANRAMSCERCLGQQATLPAETIPH